MVGHVLVQPEVVLAAAAELDLLAERLAAVATAAGPTTHVLPSGTEEVSLLAAGHFNHAALSHDRAIAQGVLELHHAAATLRAQLAQYLAQDAIRAVGIASIPV
ncbi:PE family protein [Nocardia otitidiscaviarum]|uniref:PE family protein n=1 Tax=Nocardia otitidiscaviarum TaxID=1823 RepID=A0A516NUA3_9NOCA|nr:MULTISPECIES: PE family protein [Nocardia]MBF6135976.1 PE family protein [Nocardia otitidiscaviarum]MBF6178835.1 PE family protein [Nocardia otitidiscaviarum]MBF6238019.1 PE family protein [Nocardia otitidiscaviarum]MBF6483731.1 PE family protein [Nocardia otitidiscaviarum]MCP9621879.1 PE family protein [Nocardia otitidiscaviarum]